MCDRIAGDLLMCFRTDDPAGGALREAISLGQVLGVSRTMEELGTRLGQLGLLLPPKPAIQYYRLNVIPGQEALLTNRLFSRYYQFLASPPGGQPIPSVILTNPAAQLQLAPNSLLSQAARAPAPAGVGFTFDPMHTTYKGRLSLGVGDGSGRKVLVIDSGIDPAYLGNVIARKNFVDPAVAADDNTGHGTAITGIIRDLAPKAEVIIYKVIDAKGRASEWDTLAALAAQTDADVVNMSLAFGLTSWNTPTCGRESHSSRSAVFETLIDQLAAVTSTPIIVASAGNESLTDLAYPSRFGSLVAVESVDSKDVLSDFSNHGTTDHHSKPHANVFVLPGGQQPTGAKVPTEIVGATTAGKGWCGTSFAAAYASGLIAALWSDRAHVKKTRNQVLAHLRAQADKTFAGYTAATHGEGLMRY